MNRSFAEVAITCHTDSVCLPVGNVIQTHAFVKTAYIYHHPLTFYTSEQISQKYRSRFIVIKVSFNLTWTKDFQKRPLHIKHKGNIALMQKAFCLWFGLRHHVISQAPQKTKGSSQAMWTHYFHNLHGIFLKLIHFVRVFINKNWNIALCGIYCVCKWHTIAAIITFQCSLWNSEQEICLHACKPKWSKSAVFIEGLSWLSRQKIHV